MIIKDTNKSLEGKYKMITGSMWYAVTEIYRGARLVWSAIKSCFGKGFWVNEKPWLNNDAWRNNV